MSVRTYDPKQVIITIGAVPMSGFSDGTFVEISRDEDVFNKFVGADGNTVRVRNNNTSASMTLTLRQSSPSNDVLSAFLKADELSNRGVLPVLIKDLSGNSTYFSAQGWIRGYPQSSFGKEIENREWVIDLVDLDIFVGSNN